jgi:hypothetical protein
MDDEERDRTVRLIAGCLTDLIGVAVIGLVAGIVAAMLQGCLGLR